MANRKIGIVGGMGPIAGVEMTKKFYSLIDVKYDSQYPTILLINDTSIPSRTRSFLFNEQSPTDRIVEIFEDLINLSVTDILVACNSAHYFIENYHFPKHVKFWNIIENTSKNVLRMNLKYYVVLGGEVTVYSKLYDKYLESCMTSVEYSKEFFARVREIIDIIKSNSTRHDTFAKLLEVVSNIVVDVDETVIVLACTELTFFKDDLIQSGFIVVDSVEEAVLNCINENN